MIRTTLSFCLLFGSLLAASKWLHQSNHSTPVDAPAKGSGQWQPSQEDAASAHSAPTVTTLVHRDLQIRRVSWNDDSLSDVLNALRPDRPIRREASDDQPDDAETRQDSSPAAEPDIVLTPELQELRGRLRECLAYYYFRPENTAIRSPWGAMHAMIAYGVDSELIAANRRVNAIGYLCYNGVCNGQQLFYLTNGKLQARIGPGVQGHPGQFLAMLAQSRVKTDFPLRVEGKDLTVADLIQYEKDNCRPKTELTFKLIS